MRKKERLTIDQLAANYNTVMKGKEINKNGKQLFDKVIKKAATPKPRGTK